MKFKLVTTGLLVLGLTVFGGFTINNKISTIETSEKSESKTTTTSTTPSIVVDNSGTTKTFKIDRIEAGAGQVVVLNAEVNEITVGIVLERLEAARKMGVKKVYLVLDSPGGSVFAGAKLISYIKSSGLVVDTVCAGLCASMAAHIHQVGHRRLMQDKTVLMFHPASGGARGTIEQMQNLINTIKLYVDRFDADIAKRSGIPYDKFKARLSQNYWVEAQDAVAEGLSDGLVLLMYDQLSPAITDVEEILKKRGINTTKPKLEDNNIYEFVM